MQIETENKFLWILFTITFVSFVSCVVMNGGLDVLKPKLSIESPTQCNQTDFNEYSKCINSYVNTIYQYNITNDDIQLSLDELKTRGGDCYDWSKFYQSEYKKKGFDAQIIKIVTSNTTAHAFVLANKGNNYCLIDQTDLKCN